MYDRSNPHSRPLEVTQNGVDPLRSLHLYQGKERSFPLPHGIVAAVVEDAVQASQPTCCSATQNCAVRVYEWTLYRKKLVINAAVFGSP